MGNIFTAKKVAGLAAEVTGGTYVAAVAPKFPVNDLEIPTPDLALAEYGRPANGKMTRGKYLSGAQTFAFGFTTFMNPIADITGDSPDALKTIINRDFFEMAGWRFREITVVADVFPEVYFDFNPLCKTFSWGLTTLGCYDSTDTTPAGNQWLLRGAKADFTMAAEDVGAPILITVSVSSAIEEYDPAGDTFNLTTLQDFSDVACDRFLGATTTLDGVDLDCQSFSFAQGNTIDFTKDTGKATITKEAYIADSDPKLTVTAIVGSTTGAIWAKASGNTPVGSVVITGQYYTYTFVACMVSSYSEADANGILVLTLELSVSREVKIRSLTKK